MIDLNLVRVFIAIYETGSLSAAGERLHVSQPSVSYSLARLRDILHDPLFQRSKHGVSPTFFSEQLYQRLRTPITAIESAIEDIHGFHPATSNRRFRIAMSDVGEIFFLPYIMQRLQKEAPDIVIEVINVNIEKLGYWLASGKIDAALCNRGSIPIASQGETVFTDKYVCLSCKHHPRLTQALTLEQYLTERHIVVTPETGHNLVEERLRELGLERPVALYIPHFSVLPEIILGTDLLLTLPSRVAIMLAQKYDLQWFELPFNVRPLDVMLRWSESHADFGAQKWFLQFLRDSLARILDE
ncbi:LysR family transcriptional regulator [Neokomagataea anthophila]|uniref:LysR family transcriptional regulator n=1 Tax=Neokomagataea anthophila TaxID=2826925 RepID=A0ABS5E3N2_9PROT|nr:LysR family transcriptional regulator [Neokomagataea anthophila]MBR0558504.1 LysR family transcriptional regulator [Neokomagataea anthophila]